MRCQQQLAPTACTHTSCRVTRRGPLCPVCPPVHEQAILSGSDGWETERWGSDGGAPCEELAVTQIVVDPGTRWGRGWCVVVLSDKGPPRCGCSASLSPGRPTAQGTPGGPTVSAALHTPGPRGWWGRRWHRADKGTNTLAQHLVEKHLPWGRRRAQGSGWKEARAPTPYLCSPRPRVSGWVGACCICLKEKLRGAN